MDITLFPNESIDILWTRLKPYFEGASKYSYGRYTAQDIRNKITNSPTCYIWIAHEGDEVFGFVIAEPTLYPQTKALNMHFTGGKEGMKWKADMLKTIQDFAYRTGCDIIESQGRSGWEKIFKEDGFKPRFTFYELPVKELNNGQWWK